MVLDWRSEFAALRSLSPSEASRQMGEIIVRVGGLPLRLREARSGLYLITVAVSGGSPKLLEVDEGKIVLIAVDDLAEIVCGGAFETFMKDAVKAGKKVGRRRVSNR